MPDYLTHLSVGIIAFLIFSLNFSHLFKGAGFIAIGFIVALIYSLLPDLDSDSSKINNLFELLISILGIIFFVLQYWMFFILALILLIGINMLTHRGFMHSAFAVLLFSFPLYFLNIGILWVGLISYSLHLILDTIL